MRRRTLDVVFSAGGIAVAGMLIVLGLVLQSDANFAKNYVTDQLSEQKIAFKPAEALTDEEKESACVVENAGKPLTTGKQAECYANDFIGLHLKSTADGMTYAELGVPQSELREQVAEAQKNKDRALPALQSELADITTARDTLFKGETLRGLLLTSYGFSIFGEKAGQAAMVLFGIGALMALLSIAGFVHAFVTPKDRRVRLGDFDADVVANGHSTVIEGPAPAPKQRPAGAKRPAGTKRPTPSKASTTRTRT